MSNVILNILSEFKGKAAFREADTALGRLNNKVTKLGRNLGLAFGTAAVAQFGKASLKAFAEDQAAAVRLSNAVKNLGLEFANPYITDYISNLEKTAQIADDELRPAFQRLLQQTGSIAKSQQILSTAIDVSRGSSQSLSTVTEDLAKAYYGNTKGLQKYSLGLTKAELQAKSFAQIQDILATKFAGANTEYLKTYAGQLSILSLAWNNLQENAGKALFTLAGANGDQSSGAKRLAGVVDAFGVGLVEAAKLLNNAAQAFGEAYFGFSSAKKEVVPSAKPGQELFRKSMSNDAKLKEAEKRQQALYKAQMAAMKKITDEQKKQAALKKAGTVFDMEQIQLIAALKGDLSKEERTRAEAMLAILNDNDVLAKKLTDQIVKAQDATGNLYKYFQTIGDTSIKNPFSYLDDWIVQFQKKLDALKFPTFGAVQGFTPSTVYPAGLRPGDPGFIGPVVPASNVPTGGAVANFVPDTSIYGNPTGSIQGPAAIELKVSGDSALTKAIADSLQVQSLSGIPSSVQRLVSTFG